MIKIQMKVNNIAFFDEIPENARKFYNKEGDFFIRPVNCVIFGQSHPGLAVFEEGQPETPVFGIESNDYSQMLDTTSFKSMLGFVWRIAEYQIKCCRDAKNPTKKGGDRYEYENSKFRVTAV